MLRKNRFFNFFFLKKKKWNDYKCSVRLRRRHAVNLKMKTCDERGVVNEKIPTIRCCPTDITKNTFDSHGTNTIGLARRHFLGVKSFFFSGLKNRYQFRRLKDDRSREQDKSSTIIKKKTTKLYCRTRINNNDVYSVHTNARKKCVCVFF